MNKRYPDFSDINGIERFTSADYSSTRNLVVWSSNKKGILIKDLSTGEVLKITAGGTGEGNVRFSDDEKKIMFVSNGSFGRQAFFYDVDTGEVTQVTRSSSPVIDPLLSPDGKRIIFCSQISSGLADDHSAEKVSDLDNAIVIEDFHYKFDGMGYFMPDSHMHLVVADVETGECRRLTSGECDHLHPSWCVDGEHVVCIGNKYRDKKESMGYDLLKISTDTGEVTKLTEGLDIVSYPNPVRPCMTHDGKYVYTGVLEKQDLSGNDKTAESDEYPDVYMYRVALDGSGAELVFQDDEDCYQCVQFPYNAGCGWGLDKWQMDENDKFIYFLAGWQGQGRVYRLPVDISRREKCCAETVLSGKYIYNGLSRIRNEKMLVSRGACDDPEEYLIFDLKSGKLTKVIQSAEDWLNEVEIEKTDDFFFDSTDGKSQIQGWVVPPFGIDPDEDRKYPVIVYVHGGPHPFYTYGFTPEFQAFAAAGYGVIYCNPRGTSGYGKTFKNIDQAFDGTAFDDIIQFTAEAAKRFRWIDTDRMAVTGGSYGGYMTNYIAVHENPFKVYITQRSVTNNMIAYANSDMQGHSIEYSSYEEFMLNQLERSCVARAEKINKPMLILHGADDLRTPVEGAHQFFVAIKDVHPELPVRMVIFPHTAHDQALDPRFHGRYHREMLEWLDKYL